MGRDVVPAALAGTLVVVALVWNAFVGLPFSLPIWQIVAVPVILVGLACYYLVNRPGERRLFELPFYIATWIIFPIFGCEVTYLGLEAGMSFQDPAFDDFDKAIGFDWVAYFKALDALPAINGWLRFIYSTTMWQPFITVLAAVYWLPGRRNHEFTAAILIALYVTIAVSAILPAIGPRSFYGVDPHLANFIENLRSADPKPSWFMGIICFPSFHTVMAVLFVWANRGMPTFWPFLLLNTAMLWAIPTWGNHYVVDMAGGAVVAAVAMWAAPKLVLSKARSAGSP